MDDHFPASLDAHGGGVSYQAPDEVAAGAGVMVSAATRGATSATRVASVNLMVGVYIFFLLQEEDDEGYVIPCV